MSWFSNASLAALGLVCSANDHPAYASSESIAHGTEGPEIVLFAVSVNGAPAGSPVVLLRTPGGAYYAPEEVLAEWRLKPRREPVHQDGVAYYALSELPGVQVELVAATQTLTIAAPAALFETTQLATGSSDTMAMTPSGSGGFLNYDFVAQVDNEGAGLNALIEVGAFSAGGVAISGFVGRWNEKHRDMVRLETSWTKDDPDGMRYIRIGDSITRAGLGGSPMRFAGLQLARDFTTQPGFVTMPLPSVRGEVELPSVVDVYVNNVLSERRDLPPGPFDIQNIPVITGKGEVQLVVRDLLGREVVINQDFYAARQILGRGLHDYSYEVGLLRKRFGQRSFSYGAPIIVATHRYGVTDRFTAEAHAQASPQVQMAGLGASVALGHFGTLNASAVASLSDRGTGARYQIGFESRSARLSYGASAELMDDDFVTTGGANSKWRSSGLTLQAFAGVPLGFGSLGAAYLKQSGGDGADVELLSATASIRLGRYGMLYLSGRTSLITPRDHSILLSLTIPLGAGTSASLGAGFGGRTNYRAAVQKSPPAGEGFGFRAGAEFGAFNRFDGRLSYQTNFGSYAVDLSWVDDHLGARITASGGIGFVEDHVFVSRKLTQSFAVVDVGGFPGVRVYADNHEVGTTNSAGIAVIPRLRPYEANTLRIELADLPLDADVGVSEQQIRPYDRSGVAVSFDVKSSHGALVTLAMDDGVEVPAGSHVTLSGSEQEFIVAPGGEAYLTGLAAHNSGEATWRGGSCAFNFNLPTLSELQPRIGTVACAKNLR